MYILYRQRNKNIRVEKKVYPHKSKQLNKEWDTDFPTYQQDLNVFLYSF